MPKTSRVAYAVIRLPYLGRHFFLVAKHKKWGDFSALGGHVEEGETWADAMDRELKEEIPMLMQRNSFISLPVFTEPVRWTAFSRSQNEERHYRAQFFYIRFREDPSIWLPYAMSHSPEQLYLYSDRLPSPGTLSRFMQARRNSGEHPMRDAYDKPLSFNSKDLDLITLRVIGI